MCGQDYTVLDLQCKLECAWKYFPEWHIIRHLWL